MAVQDYFKRRVPNIQMFAFTAKELIDKMRKQTEMLSLLLTTIGSISLVVGGVGIMNIMLVSVSERRQEIGIRRALGAKRRDIRNQFLTESVILSLLGGLIGVSLAFGVTYYVTNLKGWEFHIAWQVVLLGVGVSVSIGVFFGFVPAHQASKQDPIESLRGD